MTSGYVYEWDCDRKNPAVEVIRGGMAQINIPSSLKAMITVFVAITYNESEANFSVVKRL